MNEKQHILKLVESNKISPKEGFKRLKQLKQQNIAHIPKTLYLQYRWEHVDPHQIQKKALTNHVLLFDNSEHLRNALIKHNAVTGQIIRITSAERFHLVSPDTYGINPLQIEDYFSLIELLKKQNQLPGYIVHLWSQEYPFFSNTDLYNEKEIIHQIEQSLYSIFLLSKTLIKLKNNPPINICYIYPDAPNQFNPHYAAIGGFAKTLFQEKPELLCKSIGMSDQSNIIHVLRNEFQTNDVMDVRYQKDQRQIKRLQLFDRYSGIDSNQILLKEKGVYLLTGGAGGLGKIFATYLAKNYRASLILVGRSKETKDHQLLIQKLKTLGSNALYFQADISKSDSVNALLSLIKKQFHSINGIIHCAGIIRDAYIMKKNIADFSDVLASKVFGTLNIDRATKDEPLDFFVMCSSISSVFGSVGQCDYAYANSFMDHFVEIREKLRSKELRKGQTISINWPVWQEGGMHPDKETEEWIKKNTGLESLDSNTGIRAFEYILQSGQSQLIVTYGDTEKIKHTLDLENIMTNAHNTHIENHSSDQKSDYKDHDVSNAIIENTEKYLKRFLAKTLKIPESRIRSHDPLEKYGIDSVMVLELTRELEKIYGQLSKTLFFEYQTIHELSVYFIDHHKNTLIHQIDRGQDHLKNAPEPPKGTSQNRHRFILPDRQVVSTEKIAVSIDRHQKTETSIAIIGMSGRYPMADNITAFWENLKSGKDCISEIPEDRWDYHPFFSTDKDEQGKIYSKWGGFINHVDRFDARFFNISPREAELIDPQERLFLETAWHTIENAGYCKSNLWGKQIGVFVGVMWGEYQLFGPEAFISNYPMMPNSSYASIANRISYFFNFNGPSMALDTMCSSSITAIHQACHSLRMRESKMAIAGGVNVSIHPQKYLQLCQGRFASSNGKCGSFGEGGDGYVPGEGVGAVLLKPFSQAIADGDHIYAIIRGSSINHGGKTNGYTVPNPNAQATVISDVFKKTGIEPETISYIETHGTGTSLGDPIEFTGLLKAYTSVSHKKQYCPIGSVKSNIGHLESAAGIAALTKVILQMNHKQLVPSLHSNPLNPHIDFENSPFYVQQHLSQWPQPVVYENNVKRNIPRRAGISSFGAGGSNAHLILEEYVDPSETRNNHSAVISDFPQKRIIVLSAANETVLQAYAKALRDFLISEDSISNALDAIAYTLQHGRELLAERLAIIVSDTQSLAEKLTQFIQGETGIDHLYRGNTHSTQTVFIEGRAGKEFIRILTEDRDLDKLAQLWVSGATIQWKFLDSSQKPNRIPLPSYPFERKRHWIGYAPGHSPVQKIDSQKRQKTNASTNKKSTRRAITDYLIKTMAAIARLDPNEIDPEDDFENYGLDSIMISQLNTNLTNHFGELPSTLFFKYKNLTSLSEYLFQNFPEKTSDVTSDKVMNSSDDDDINNINDESKENQQFIPLSIFKQNNADLFQQYLINDDIAIIGHSAKYPYAETADAFWENLKNSRDCISEIPTNRWDYKQYPDMYCKWGGFLSDVDIFDPSFFNISPNTARFMDPHERLFLETSWACFEDAGYTRKRLEKDTFDHSGNIGVFAGVGFNEYQLYSAQEWTRGNIIPMTSQIFSVANRVSYHMNFSGPSLSLDTACSSSLYAIHLACESLIRGECHMAIAGGVNLSLHPAKYVTLCMSQFAATDGRCRSFGEGGDGYVPGEGVGAILLKPLSKAVKDNDHIYAIIKGTAVNHDGKTQGYTVPNPVAQSDVIRKALSKARIDPRTISYIEAHGTGTSLGDPIEITGLNDVFQEKTNEKQFCAIGSVKSNIGHPEAAAGIAQISKVLLQMKNKSMVPTLLHSKNTNPNIDFETTPFYVQQKYDPWDKPVIQGKTYPRRAGISSFGAGGVNVHVILEEYPSKKSRPESIVAKHTNQKYIIPLSAKRQDNLYEYVEALKEFIENNFNTLYIEDIAYSFQLGREPLAVRKAFVAENLTDLIERLNGYEKTGTGTTSEMNQQTQRKNLRKTVSKSDLVSLIQAKRFNELAELWTNGADIDWTLLYTNGHIPNQISLPTYPFSKERYWVFGSEKDVASDKKEEKNILDTKPDKADLQSTGQKTKKEKPLAADFMIELAEAPEVEQIEMLSEYLQEQLGNLLGFDPDNLPSFDQGFFDMGMESIQIAQFHSVTEQAFGLKLSDTLFFDYSTIVDLSGYLLKQMSFDDLIQDQDLSSDDHLLEEDGNILNEEELDLLAADPLPDDIQQMNINDVETFLALEISMLE
jgi:acyl transferase domain-containing protein/NADP-dependent 3-hydroxy acid dehydrogenase YdfG